MTMEKCICVTLPQKALSLAPFWPSHSQECLLILAREFSCYYFLESTSSRHKMDVEMKDGKLKSFIRLGMHKRHRANVIRKTIKVLLFALEIFQKTHFVFFLQRYSVIDWSRNCCRAVKDLMRISREIIRRKKCFVFVLIVFVGGGKMSKCVVEDLGRKWVKMLVKNIVTINGKLKMILLKI